MISGRFLRYLGNVTRPTYINLYGVMLPFFIIGERECQI